VVAKVELAEERVVQGKMAVLRAVAAWEMAVREAEVMATVAEAAVAKVVVAAVEKVVPMAAAVMAKAEREAVMMAAERMEVKKGDAMAVAAVAKVEPLEEGEVIEAMGKMAVVRERPLQSRQWKIFDAVECLAQC
jgi:hypothetical protein